MKHAKLSPSASHRWLVCPGSVAANANKPFEQSSYALEGTTAHALLELCLRLGDEPTNYIGDVLDEGLMPIDDAMADGVGYALDYIKAYVADNPKAHVYVEHSVAYGKQIGCEDDEAFGTSDVIIDNYPKELVVLDYKHGIGITVSVKKNSQLRLYSAGMRHQRGRYQRYRNVVVQPRVPKRKPVQEASITDAELVKWLDTEVRPVVPIALAKDAPRVAGDHCRYCVADGNCAAQYEAVQQAAAKEFKVKDPKRLTPAQIGKLLDTLHTIEQIGKAVKEHAVQQAHAGVTIPGYEPDFTNARRIWVSDEEANELLSELGLEKKERFKVELLTPAQAEKKLKEKKLWPKKPRGSAGADFVDPLHGVLDYTDRNPTIIRKAPEDSSDT
jgi:hypothetical protein